MRERESLQIGFGGLSCLVRVGQICHGTCPDFRKLDHMNDKAMMTTSDLFRKVKRDAVLASAAVVAQGILTETTNSCYKQ